MAKTMVLLRGSHLPPVGTFSPRNLHHKPHGAFKFQKGRGVVRPQPTQVPHRFTGNARPFTSNSNSVENDNVPPPMDEISVLRFTLGIEGFDESNLPRIIGILFGFLLVLNHVLTQSSVPAAQLRSELVGLFLAGVAVSLPYFGKRLKGMSVTRQQKLPAKYRQVFLMSENLSHVDVEDLAWGSYALLRNTVSMSLLIYDTEVLCARGCWDVPPEASKHDIFTLLEKEIEISGLSNVMTTLYFPKNADRQGWEMVPKGAASLLVQPYNSRTTSNDNVMHSGGIILLLSSMPKAYGEKEQAWIAAFAKKFEKIQLTLKD